jgi:hypothetical protein
MIVNIENIVATLCTRATKQCPDLNTIGTRIERISTDNFILLRLVDPMVYYPSQFIS